MRTYKDKDNNILVSIIMPIYNAENTLDISLKSILNQKFKEFELILVNDGSTDKSYDICLKYSKIDSRIKVIDCVNNGVSAARNIGINNSVGEYIVFCDSDDWVEYDWCEQLYFYANNNRNNFILCGINRTYLNSKETQGIVFNKSKDISILKKKEFYDVYSRGLLNFPFNKIYKSNIILENSLCFDENLSLGEDLLFNLEYLKKVSGDIVVINKALYNYVVKDSKSLSNIYYENFFEIQKVLYKEIYKTIELLNGSIINYKKDYYSKYLIDIIWSLNNTFKKDNKMSFSKKLRVNSEILKSKETSICLKEFDRNSFNKIHRLILITRSSFLEYIYQIIRRKINIDK